MQRLHVVAHNGSDIWGGGEIGTAQLLAGLQARGHRVRMLFRNRELAGRAAALGIPADVLHLGGPAALHHAARLAAELRRARPDAVLLTTFKKVFLGALGARLAGVPRVVQRVVIEGNVPRRLHQQVALRRWVDAVALNAEHMRAAFLAAGPGLDPVRVVTLYDGVRVPARTAAPGALRAELGIPADAPVVGAVARLAGQKRFDRLLDALADLPAEVHCVIAGEGPGREPLLSRAAALGLADRFHLPGFRADVGNVLDALDVFVVSSDREGMANAMLEAMAFGLPVVSTDVSGAREALEPLPDGRAPGAVVARDPVQLAGALRRLLEDDARRAQSADAARERARERFGWDRFLDEWEALLAGAVR